MGVGVGMNPDDVQRLLVDNALANLNCKRQIRVLLDIIRLQ